MVWEHHLIYCAPNAYRVPGDMVFRDFLEQVFQPDYAHHPDVDKVDWEQGVWQLDNEDWTPDFGKSLKENNIAHNSFIRVEIPGLEGMHGAENQAKHLENRSAHQAVRGSDKSWSNVSDILF